MKQNLEIEIYKGHKVILTSGKMFQVSAVGVLDSFATYQEALITSKLNISFDSLTASRTSLSM